MSTDEGEALGISTSSDGSRKRSSDQIGTAIQTAGTSKRASVNEEEFSPTSQPLPTSRDGPDGDTDRPKYFLIKSLCPNPICGSVIGARGSIIAEAQQKYGTRIKLSQNNEYFPGTFERVLCISGPEIPGVLATLEEFVTRIAEAPEKKQLTRDSDAMHNSAADGKPTIYKFEVLIPLGASGTLIGKGGTIIQKMNADTDCRMKMVGHKDQFVELTKERKMIFTATTIEKLVQGVMTAIAQLFSEPTLCSYINTRTHYPVPPQHLHQQHQQHHHQQPHGDGYYGGGAGAYGAGPSFGQHGGGAPYAGHGGGYQNYQQDMGMQQGMFPQQYGHQQQYGAPGTPKAAGSLDITPPSYAIEGDVVTMTLGVPDANLGCLIGQKGNSLREICQNSGARIQMSQKDEFLPGTTHRKVNATGNLQQVQMARSIIFAKLQEHASQMLSK